MKVIRNTMSATAAFLAVTVGGCTTISGQLTELQSQDPQRAAAIRACLDKVRTAYKQANGEYIRGGIGIFGVPNSHKWNADSARLEIRATFMQPDICEQNPIGTIGRINWLQAYIIDQNQYVPRLPWSRENQGKLMPQTPPQ